MIRILVFFLYCNRIFAESADSSRTLVIANGGVIKLIIGLTMPVELPVSLIWLQNLQFQYSMIDKASQLTYLNLLRKSADRVLTRNVAYSVLAEYWSRFGTNGTDCILRLICDVNRYSLSHNGLIGQLLYTVFTPHRTSNKIYRDAMELGIINGKCSDRYSFCRNNILDLFLK